MALYFKAFTIGFLALWFTQRVTAQVSPPDFQCIFSDTLFWDNTTNACGPYLSTDIYISNTLTGPFSLLISLTDQTLDNYFHPNTSAADRYYFLQHNFDCPGQQLESSDTLSNLPLENAVITFVTVDNGNSQVNWIPSGSPQVTGYIIYRITSIGTVPIDTVSAATTTYTDAGSSPGQAPVGYFVVALDPCQNTSNFFNQNTTIHLTGAAENCDESISLDWTLYGGWSNVETQEIYLSLAGTTPEKVADLSGSETTFEIENIISGVEYCVYIEARETSTGFVSRSNEFCITPLIIDQVDLLKLTNLSVRQDNTVEVSWFWETDIQVESLEFENGLSPNELSSSFSMTPGTILGNENTGVDPQSDGSLGRTYYQLVTIDPCGRFFSSDLGSTIFLSGSPGENLMNNLTWTELDIEGANLIGYRLFRNYGNVSEEISLDSPFDRSFIDIPDPEELAQAEICYYAVAEFELVLPDGSLKNYEARSNEVCILQSTKIQVPNAFAPAGINSLFRPLISFDQDIIFVMKIYNRWGAKIFETDDHLAGWDGRRGLQEMPMGGYVYVIEVTQPNGETIKKDGPFVLIR